jgi:hypothetical protein
MQYNIKIKQCSSHPLDPQEFLQKKIAINRVHLCDVNDDINKVGYLPSFKKCCLRILGLGLLVNGSNTAEIVNIVDAGKKSPKRKLFIKENSFFYKWRLR